MGCEYVIPKVPVVNWSNINLIWKVNTLTCLRFLNNNSETKSRRTQHGPFFYHNLSSLLSCIILQCIHFWNNLSMSTRLLSLYDLSNRPVARQLYWQIKCRTYVIWVKNSLAIYYILGYTPMLKITYLNHML